MVSVKRINKFMNGEELDPENVQHSEKESEYLQTAQKVKSKN